MGGTRGGGAPIPPGFVPLTHQANLADEVARRWGVDSFVNATGHKIGNMRRALGVSTGTECCFDAFRAAVVAALPPSKLPRGGYNVRFLHRGRS